MSHSSTSAVSVRGGLPALVLVAIIGNYALFAMTMIPALVSGWVSHFNVTTDVAGWIGTAALLGQTCGLFAGIKLVSRWPLPKIALVGFCLAVGTDLLSIVSPDIVILAAARILNGISLGLLLAATVNWFSRHPQAERAFGMFTMFQFFIPSVLIVAIPFFQPYFGHVTVYVCALFLAMLSLGAFPMLKLNGGDRPVSADPARAKVHQTRTDRYYLISSIGAFSLFNLGLLGTWAFTVSFGETAGLSASVSMQIVGFSAAFGMLGAFLVYMIGMRFGMTLPVSAGFVLLVASIVSFAFLDGSPIGYAVALCALHLVWGFLYPYIQAGQAALDRTGRLNVWGMIAASIGGSIGPAILGTISAQTNLQVGFLSAAGIIATSALFLIPVARHASRTSGEVARTAAETGAEVKGKGLHLDHISA